MAAVGIDLAMLIEGVVGGRPGVQRLAAFIAHGAIFNLGIWQIIEPRLGKALDGERQQALLLKAHFAPSHGPAPHLPGGRSALGRYSCSAPVTPPPPSRAKPHLHTQSLQAVARLAARTCRYALPHNECAAGTRTSENVAKRPS